MMTLFDKFGGVRPMAEHLREAPSTVQSWKTSGRVPAGRQPAVLEKAQELGLDVTAEDVVFPLGRPDVADDVLHADSDTAESVPPSAGKADHVSASEVAA
ncbi:hypothetical protein DFR49_3387 [Hephaestia caeni]|uniref:Uncharacterized protein n=1 Tax=Hephaestia caeni TaxID=645617 RepID=A0A397NIZ6_9SPHN|nr:helix-turn-helix domain-containing protein [Hephaestia caeni]RIA37502.1 hypothetical protein DFR49_3387 [Hephaestia caeni]